jgi:hypothetical protein
MIFAVDWSARARCSLYVLNFRNPYDTLTMCCLAVCCPVVQPLANRARL